MPKRTPIIQQAEELFDPGTSCRPFMIRSPAAARLPLEAQRLGLEAHASELNPVAVLINKAMIEIPPKFAGQPPVNPEARKELDHSKSWRGAQGLAEDVRHYGKWMRDEAEKRIGHLYPKVADHRRRWLSESGRIWSPTWDAKLTVIAWLWARTVKSLNPAFADVDVPLASTFMLSTKKGKEAYVRAGGGGQGSYRFDGQGRARRAIQTRPSEEVRQAEATARFSVLCQAPRCLSSISGPRARQVAWELGLWRSLPRASDNASIWIQNPTNTISPGARSRSGSLICCFQIIHATSIRRTTD